MSLPFIPRTYGIVHLPQRSHRRRHGRGHCNPTGHRLRPDRRRRPEVRPLLGHRHHHRRINPWIVLASDQRADQRHLACSLQLAGILRRALRELSGALPPRHHCGTIQILVSVFKLGDLTRYVSESVILGFMAGAGLLIAVGQIGNFLGAAKKGTGDQSVLYRTWLTVSEGWPFNWRAIALGVATIILVVGLRKLIIKYKLPKVDMLVGLIVFTLIAVALGWTSAVGPKGKALVSVVGAVPAALPSFHIPENQLGLVWTADQGCPGGFPPRICWKHSRWRSRSPPTPGSRWIIIARSSPKASAMSWAASFNRCLARDR